MNGLVKNFDVVLGAAGVSIAFGLFFAALLL